MRVIVAMENLPTPFPLLDHPELLVPMHMHTEESLDYARNFPIQDGDIFNVTFPKSGTTWMQEILTLVTSNGDLSQVKTRPSWERVPWLEQNTAKEFLEKRAAPRLISTHLPYEYAPAQLSKGRGKVIYTARNPKDITISYYYFSKFVKFLEDPGDFKDFTNKMIYGTGETRLRAGLEVGGGRGLECFDRGLQM
uniref:Sulfotransferase n=1 Tax=Eptatretus burgeri TaxID=7764 RepID=A0A8C4MZ89_EPTBU